MICCVYVCVCMSASVSVSVCLLLSSGSIIHFYAKLESIIYNCSHPQLVSSMTEASKVV